MLDPTILAVAFIAGAMASLLYFGGLWLTVQRLPRVANPTSLYLTSFVVRLSMLVAIGLFAVLRLEWQQLLATMFGFLVVRYLMTLTLGFQSATTPDIRPRNQS